MGIGKRIRERRESRNMTQAQLAESVGVTPSAITNYENETSHPKEVVLYRLFDALGCDANYLFQDEFQGADNIEQNDIFDMYNKLDEIDRAAARGFLSGLLRADKYNKSNGQDCAC